jgi:phosphatidylglycerophosphate synthase
MPEVINKNIFSFDKYIYNFIKKLPDITCYLEPNYITVLNYFITFLIVYLIYKNQNMILITILVIFRSFLDILDGAIARKCNKSSKLGAKLDIIGDILLFILLNLVFYVKASNKIIKNLFFVTILISIFISINVLFNYKNTFSNKYVILFHDNTIVCVPLLVLFCTYLIKINN